MNDLESRLRADGAAWRRDTADIDSDVSFRAFVPPSESHFGKWLVPLAAAMMMIPIMVTSLLIIRPSEDPRRDQATAGNGSSASASSSPSPAPSGSADALSPSPVPAGQVAPLTQLTADQTVGMTSTPWRFSSLSPDGITVTVTWATGSCATAGYEATESDEAVQIRVLTGQRPPPSGFICNTRLTTAAGTIALSRPLGIRQLLHGPVG
jgi:hypothetical protein